MSDIKSALARPVLFILILLSLLAGSIIVPGDELAGRSVEAASPQSRRRSSRRRSSRRPRVAKRTAPEPDRGRKSTQSAPENGSGAIDEPSLRAHIRYLADDLLEGRGTGTRGGMLAARYIAAQFESLGLEPASPDGSYFQMVKMLGTRTEPATKLTFASSSGSIDLSFGEQYVAGTDLEQTELPVDGELVFVGYGISSAEEKWDDYKGYELRGKILLMLVNEPPPTPDEPQLFAARALTYYGRWSYKFEEAARRGAAGVLLVHTSESAGYGWNVVRNSWSGERFSLLSDREATTFNPPLGLKSWITEESARQVARLGGLDFDHLRRSAAARDFQPVPIPVRMSTLLRSQVRQISSPNVVAIHRGRDPLLRRQFVVYTSHWDHLGMRPDQPGDNIYNGAVDNATGISGMIALARAYTSLLSDPLHPRRSIIFIATTAEEQGLLGAEYYVRHPLVPLADTVATINLDSLNVLGKTSDTVPLGAERSRLGPLVAEVARQNGLTISPEASPEQGAFFRSDHFPFAKANIPAISLLPGTRLVGHSEAWVAQQRADYAQRYHQPGDEYNPYWDLSGMVQQVQLAYAIGLRVANEPE
jgi:Zn-dependent M28 family amino/carboxypeptidase